MSFAVPLLAFLAAAAWPQPPQKAGTPPPATSKPDSASMKEREPGEMVWRFREKDRFIVETQATIQQQRRAAGFPEFRDQILVNTVSTFLVRKVEEDGTVVFDQKIDSTRIRFEGNHRLAAAAMADLFTKMQGSTFRITLGPDRTVKSLEGYEEMIKRLAATQPPDQVARFRTFVTEDDLKSATEEGFGFLPDKPVKVGDSWTRPCKLHMAGLGATSTKLVYTVESISPDGKAKLKVTNEGSEFKPGTTAGQARPDFTIDSRTGTLVFDIKNGRLVSSEIQLKLRGSTLIPHPMGGPGQLALDLNQQNSVKITVKDRSPRQ